MAIVVFVLGKSGTGKSTSLRNFKSDEILHINVMSKPLPFKGRFTDTYDGDDYKTIVTKLNDNAHKVAVIDDAQYLMANEFMRRSSEKGYDKFTEIGYNFWALVTGCTNDLPNDHITYFLMHTDSDDQGNEKAKTIGKLLDEKICVEGLTSIVLKTCVKDGVYTFTTQNNGHDTVKSPLGMFSTFEIDNDLKAVDTAIRAYWNIGGDAADLQEQHDAEVDSGGVSTATPDAPKRERRRRERATETPADAPAEDKAANDTPRRTRRQRGAESATEGITEDKPRTRRRRRESNSIKEELGEYDPADYD